MKANSLTNKIRHRFSVLKAVAIITYKEWSAYRTHSMVSIFVGPVYFIIQYFIWKAVYGGANAISGIEFEQIVRYFGATALIEYLTMDFAAWNLSMLVRTGKFLTFSLRPLHHRFFALSQKIGHRFLGFLFEFLPCLLIFIFVFGIDMTPVYPIWTLLSVILAFLMNFYVNYTLGLLSFWLVESSGVRSVYSILGFVLSGSLFPLMLLPDGLQKLLFFLPFQYTTYVPAMVFSGSYSLGGISRSIPEIVGIQAIAVVVVFIISELLYRASMRHFTAVGA